MAEESGQINVEANVADQGFKSGLDAINSALNSAMQRFNAVSQSSRDLRRSVDGTEQALNGLRQNLKGVSGSINTLKNNQLALAVSYRQTKNAVVELNAALKQQKAENAQASASTQRVLQYNQALAGSYQAIARASKAADLKAVATAYNSSAQRMNYTAMRLTAGLTLPLTMFMRKGFDSLKRLNEEVIRTEKLLGDAFGGGAEGAKNLDLAMKQLGQGLDGITRKWGISRELVQGLAGDFAELGISSPRILTDLTRITAEVEKLGNVDITQSQAFVQSIFQNILRVKREAGQDVVSTKALDQVVGEVRGAISLFNYAENKTSLSLKNIADAFPEVSAAATSFGLSMASTAGLLVPMVAAGFQVGASANSIKVSLQRLVIPTKQNMQILQTLQKELGPDLAISSTIGVKGIQGLVDAFQKLRKSQYGTQGTLELFGRIFGVRQGPRMEVALEQQVQFEDMLQKQGTAEFKIAQALEDRINAQLKANRLSEISLKTYSGIAGINELSTKKEKMAINQVSNRYRTQNQQVDEYTRKAKIIQKVQSEMAKEIAKGSELQGEFNKISTETGRILLGNAFGTGVTGTTLQNELEKAEKRLDVQYGKARESIKFIQRELVTVFGDILNVVNPILQKLSEWFKNLPSSIKKIAGIGILILMAIGPVVRMIGLIRQGMGGIATVQSKMAGGFGLVKKKAVEVNTALLKQSDIMARLGKKGTLAETGGKVFLTARRGTLKKVQRLGELETQRELTGSVTAGFKERRLIKKLGLGPADFSGLKDNTVKSLFGITTKKTKTTEDILSDATKIKRVGGAPQPSGGIVTPYGVVRPQIQIDDKVKQSSTNSLRTILEQIKAILEAIKQCVCNAKQSAGVKPAPAATGAPANAPPAPSTPSVRPAPGGTSGSTTTPSATPAPKPTPTPTAAPKPIVTPVPAPSVAPQFSLKNPLNKPLSTSLFDLTRFVPSINDKFFANVSQNMKSGLLGAVPGVYGTSEGIQGLSRNTDNVKSVIDKQVQNTKNLIDSLTKFDATVQAQVTQAAEATKKATATVRKKIQTTKMPAVSMPSGTSIPAVQAKVFKAKELKGLESEKLVKKVADSIDSAVSTVTSDISEASTVVKETKAKTNSASKKINFTKQEFIKLLQELGYEIPQEVAQMADFAQSITQKTLNNIKTTLAKPKLIGASPFGAVVPFGAKTPLDILIGGKEEGLTGKRGPLPKVIQKSLASKRAQERIETKTQSKVNAEVERLNVVDEEQRVLAREASVAEMAQKGVHVPPVGSAKKDISAFKKENVERIQAIRDRLLEIGELEKKLEQEISQIMRNIKIPPEIRSKGPLAVDRYTAAVKRGVQDKLFNLQNEATTLNEELTIRSRELSKMFPHLKMGDVATTPDTSPTQEFLRQRRTPDYERNEPKPLRERSAAEIVKTFEAGNVKRNADFARTLVRQEGELLNNIENTKVKIDKAVGVQEQDLESLREVETQLKDLEAKAAKGRAGTKAQSDRLSKIEELKSTSQRIKNRLIGIEKKIAEESATLAKHQDDLASVRQKLTPEMRQAAGKPKAFGGPTRIVSPPVLKIAPDISDAVRPKSLSAAAASGPTALNALNQQLAATLQMPSQMLDAFVQTLKIKGGGLAEIATSTESALRAELAQLQQELQKIGLTVQEAIQNPIDAYAKLRTNKGFTKGGINEVFQRLVLFQKTINEQVKEGLDATSAIEAAKVKTISRFQKTGGTATTAASAASGKEAFGYISGDEAAVRAQRKQIAANLKSQIIKENKAAIDFMQFEGKTLEYIGRAFDIEGRGKGKKEIVVAKLVAKLKDMGITVEKAVADVVEKPIRKAKKAVEEATAKATAQVQDNVVEVVKETTQLPQKVETVVNSVKLPLAQVNAALSGLSNANRALFGQTAAGIPSAPAGSSKPGPYPMAGTIFGPTQQTPAQKPVIPIVASRVGPPSIKDIPIPSRPSRVEKNVPFGERVRQSTGMPVTAKGAARFGAGVVTAGFSEAGILLARTIAKAIPSMFGAQKVSYQNPYDTYRQEKRRTTAERDVSPILRPGASARQRRKAEIEARQAARDVNNPLKSLERLSGVINQIPSKFALKFKPIRDNIEAIGKLYGPGLIQSLQKAKEVTARVSAKALSIAKNVTQKTALAPLALNELIFQGTVSGLEKLKSVTNNVDPIIKKGINRVFDGLRGAITQSAEANAKRLENEPAGRLAFSNALFKTVNGILGAMQIAANMYVSYARILVNTTAQAGIIFSKGMIAAITFVGNPARAAAMTIAGIKNAGAMLGQAFRDLPGTLKQGVNFAISGTKSLFGALGNAVKALGPGLVALASRVPIVGRPLFGGVVTQNQQGQNVRSGGLFRSAATQQSDGSWSKTGPGFGGRALVMGADLAKGAMKGVASAAGGLKKAFGGAVGAAGNLASMMAYSLGPAGYLLMPMINSVIAGVAKLQMKFIIIAVVVGLVVAVIKSLKNTFSQWSGSSNGAAERFKKTWEEIKKLFLGLMNVFIGFFMALTGGGKDGEKGAKDVGSAVSDIADAFEKALPVIKKVFEVLKQGLTTFLSGAKVVIEGVIKLISGIIDTVKGVFALIKGDNEKASQLFSSAWEKVKGAFGKIFAGLIKIFGTALKIIINVLAKVLEFIINVFERIGDVIVLAIQYSILGVIKAFFFIPRTIVKIVDQVVDIWTELSKITIDIYKFIVTKFVEFFFKIPSAAVTVVQKVINIFAGLVGGTATIINKLADMFFGFFQSIIDAPKKLGWLGDLISKALDVTVGSALDGVKGLVDGITSKISEGAESFKNFTGDLAGDIQNKITSAKEASVGAINSIANTGKGVLSFMAGLGDDTLGILDKMQKAAESGVTNVANGARNALGGASGSVISISDYLIGWIDKVSGGIENIPEATLKAVKDVEEEVKNLDPSAAERAGETIADAINKGLKNLKQNFFDKVLGNLDKSLGNLGDKLKKALEKQKEEALKVFDDQIAAIDALAAAEEELTAKEKAEADKRDRERERQLQRQNNFRQRALAIYEGRIDDARSLLEEEQKAQIDYDKAVRETQLEEDRAARAKNREIAKGVITNQKNAASEQFDKTIEDFGTFVDELIGKGTYTQEELTKNFNSIASQAGLASTAMQNSLESYFTAIPSLITQYAGPNAEFFGTSLNTLVDLAKTKYGIDTQNASPDSILGATGAMLSGTATAIESAFREKILPNYDTGQNKIADINKKISDPTSDLNPAKVYGKAISDASEAIKREFMKMKTEASSAFAEVIAAINDELKDLAISQAITEAKEELKKAPKTIAGAISSAGMTKQTPDQALASVLFGDIWSQPLKNADGSIIYKADGTPKTLGDAFTGRYYGGMIKKMYGGGVPKYAVGGSVPGVAMKGVPALLHGGEYVINSKAVQNIGTSFLQYLNGLRNGIPQIKLPNAQIPNNMSSATSVNNNTQVETTHNYNIFVDNFIGENQWFESMMKEYNLKVVPNSQKAAGLESRVIRSYNGINKGL